MTYVEMKKRSSERKRQDGGKQADRRGQGIERGAERGRDEEKAKEKLGHPKREGKEEGNDWLYILKWKEVHRGKTHESQETDMCLKGKRNRRSNKKRRFSQK